MYYVLMRTLAYETKSVVGRVRMNKEAVCAMSLTTCAFVRYRVKLPIPMNYPGYLLKNPVAFHPKYISLLSNLRISVFHIHICSNLKYICVRRNFSFNYFTDTLQMY